MNEFAKPNLAVSQIPSSSVADAGKALVVGEDGVPIWGSGGGGSGGGSGGGVLIVNLTFDEDAGYLVFDKTWSEVNAASAAVAYFDMSAFGGRGAWRLPIGDPDVIGSGDGSFTYRVFAMKMDFGTMDDGSKVSL
jgi:hypothetical protein